MKALIAILLCMVAKGMAGDAVPWPGAAVAVPAPLLHTLQPATKSYTYSSAQYINTIPASYSYGIRPQIAYEIPRVTAFAPLPGLQAIYPVASASFIPSNVFYPQLSPAAPSPPQQSEAEPPKSPNAPEQPSSQPILPSETPGDDSDTTVIESAEFINQQRNQQLIPSSDGQSQSSLPVSTDNNSNQQPSSETGLNQQNPEISQFASLPQIPQLSDGIPQFPPLPQFPQAIPQFPQFPQLPQFPQFPPNQGSISLPPFLQSNPQFSLIQDSSSPQQSPVLQNPASPQIPQFPMFPSPQFPSSLPQIPQLPSIPQIPPAQVSVPQLPQLPAIPQFPPPQSGLPQLPQLPSIPQFPPNQGGAFSANGSAADNSNKGLNDEDTITVESAK